MTDLTNIRTALLKRIWFHLTLVIEAMSEGGLDAGGLQNLYAQVDAEINDRLLSEKSDENDV